MIGRFRHRTGAVGQVSRLEAIAQAEARGAGWAAKQAVGLSVAANACYLLLELDGEISRLFTADGAASAFVAMVGPWLVYICSHRLMHRAPGWTTWVEKTALWGGFLFGVMVSAAHMWSMAYHVASEPGSVWAGFDPWVRAVLAAIPVAIGVELTAVGALQQAARARAELRAFAEQADHTNHPTPTPVTAPVPATVSIPTQATATATVADPGPVPIPAQATAPITDPAPSSTAPTAPAAPPVQATVAAPVEQGVLIPLGESTQFSKSLAVTAANGAGPSDTTNNTNNTSSGDSKQ